MPSRHHATAGSQPLGSTGSTCRPADRARDQPVRFGLLGDLSDFPGRIPRVVAVDRSGDEPGVVYAHSGRFTVDRPEVDELLDAVDEHLGADGSPSANE